MATTESTIATTPTKLHHTALGMVKRHSHLLNQHLYPPRPPVSETTVLPGAGRGSLQRIRDSQHAHKHVGVGHK